MSVLADSVGQSRLLRRSWPTFSAERIHEGLNVVENWNSANGFIRYGNGGELATNRRDDQELAVLCLHLLQASLVYINTLMTQQVVDDPATAITPEADDLRGLSPLLWSHVKPTASSTSTSTSGSPSPPDPPPCPSQQLP